VVTPLDAAVIAFESVALRIRGTGKGGPAADECARGEQDGQRTKDESLHGISSS